MTQHTIFIETTDNVSSADLKESLCQAIHEGDEEHLNALREYVVDISFEDWRLEDQ